MALTRLQEVEYHERMIALIESIPIGGMEVVEAYLRLQGWIAIQVESAYWQGVADRQNNSVSGHGFSIDKDGELRDE